jgi:hypothetical protein
MHVETDDREGLRDIEQADVGRHSAFDPPPLGVREAGCLRGGSPAQVVAQARQAQLATEVRDDEPRLPLGSLCPLLVTGHTLMLTASSWLRPIHDMSATCPSLTHGSSASWLRRCRSLPRLGLGSNMAESRMQGGG